MYPLYELSIYLIARSERAAPTSSS
jgi:hypothetical protein